MRLNCEIKSRDIIPGDISRSLGYMSRKANDFAGILKEHKASNIHVAINPDEGFLMSFECALNDAEEIFRKIKLAALK